MVYSEIFTHLLSEKLSCDEPIITSKNSIPDEDLLGKVLMFSEDFSDPRFAGEEILIIDRTPDLSLYQGVFLRRLHPNYPTLKKLCDAEERLKCSREADFTPVYLGGDTELGFVKILLPDFSIASANGSSRCSEVSVSSDSETFKRVLNGNVPFAMLIFGHKVLEVEELCQLAASKGCAIVDATSENVFSNVSHDQLMNRAASHYQVSIQPNYFGLI